MPSKRQVEFADSLVALVNQTYDDPVTHKFKPEAVEEILETLANVAGQVVGTLAPNERQATLLGLVRDMARVSGQELHEVAVALARQDYDACAVPGDLH